MIVDLNLPKYNNMTELEATNAMAQEITQDTMNRNLLKREIRSYEVSLWTLQDEFITVLKWSDVEQQGRIQNPKMTLNVDGTQHFTFSIPMYLNVFKEQERFSAITNMNYSRIEKEENPNWFNDKMKSKVPQDSKWEQFEAGYLLTGMRKIKVIFNKGTDIEQVFEFIITKVTESHNQDQLMCDVECEGLAFNELGKIGYKITLSADNFYVDHDDWFENDGNAATEPRETVQYWCEKCNLIPLPQNNNTILDPTKWYYDIRMYWPSASSSERLVNKVYENEYVSSWDDNLIPTKVESAREKERSVSAENSNIYNITQTIAETFEIYCKYEYRYDENYHIIGKIVVFYNNYLQDEEDVISFLYPYLSKTVTREIDSTELVTKMYVTPQQDDSTLNGTVNIMNSSANPSSEDYLLNFDYMYTIGAITEEQYDKVHEFEKQMHNINKELKQLALTIDAYEARKIELEADITVAGESIALAQEQIDTANALYNDIDSDDGDANGYFTRDGANHYTTLLQSDGSTGGFYITFNDQDKGIDASSIAIYQNYTANAAQPFTVPISIASNGIITNPETGDITRVKIDSSYSLPVSGSKLVHVTYRYAPKLYYEQVVKAFTEKKNNSEDEKELKQEELDGLNEDLEDTKNEYKDKLEEKNLAVQAFESMMGPALREGYWSPEEYNDYGEQKNTTITLPSTFTANALIADAENGAIVNWDNDLFKDEDKIYYEEGVNLNKVYYPCVDLSNYLSFVSTNLQAGTIFSFVFNNNYRKDLTNAELNQVQNLSNFALGGGAKLGFIKLNNNNVKPVLVLTGAQHMTEEQIKFMLTSGTGKGNPRLCIMETPIVSGAVQVNLTSVQSLSADKFFWLTDKVSGVQDITTTETVYPRIKFSNTNLKTSDDCLYIQYANTLLTKYVDYQVLTKDITRDNQAFTEYFVTLKSEAILKQGTYTGNIEIDYVLSNAETSIYLDAKDVMKDSAFPRVAYTLTINTLNNKYMRKLYSMLAQLVMINDVELKFKDTFGYISQIDLDLDQPQNDEIEIKNYTTKFEDLFNTIVAETEEMKRNETAIAAAAGGKIALETRTFESTLGDNYSVLEAYLDSYFDSSDFVRERLASLFTEAGTILADSNTALGNVYNLNSENASILGGFAAKIKNQFSPKSYTSTSKPASYNVGDIWNEVDPITHKIIGRYVATASSTDSAGGFTRVYDGSLASITGASLNVDAVEGTVEILAKNKIDIKSGGYLYLEGENVDIVGNKQVNIGGATINIAALSKDGVNYSAGGINLISASTTSGSRILMSPTKITIGGATIEMYSGSTGTTSAIKIDGNVNAQNPTPGIWLGSEKSIQLFSGNDYTGSNVQLTPTHIIMGVTSGNNTSAFELQKDFLIMAVGTTGSDFSSSNVTLDASITGSLTGMKLTKDSFGLAVVNNNVRTVILANSDGITLGTGTNPITNGSYVKISGTKVEIGSLGELYVNMNNFKLQTDVLTGDTTATTRLAIGRGLHNIDATTIANIGTAGDAFVGLVYNKTGLFISGVVYANDGQFSGTITAVGNNGKFIADSTHFGLYKSDGTTAILTADANGNLTAGGDLTISAGKSLSLNVTSAGTININSNNFKVDSSATGTNAIFYVGTGGITSSDKYIKYSLTNGLEIQGGITATTLTVGDGTFMSYSSSNGLVIGSGTNKLQYKDSILSISGGITATSLSLGDINSDNALSYDSSNNLGLIIKGNVTANNGAIAGWTINPEFLRTGTTSDRTKMVTLVGADAASHNVTEGEHINNDINLNKWAMYAGAQWPEDAPGYDVYQTPGPLNSNSSIRAIGWAPFRVMRNGETYIKNLCVGNGPSNLTTDEVSYTSWAGYEGKMWFWVKGTDSNNVECYRWITIDGQQLYNLLEDVGRLWQTAYGGNSRAKSTDALISQALAGGITSVIAGGGATTKFTPSAM